MDERVRKSVTEDELSFDLEDEYQRKPVAEKVIRLLTSDIDVSPMVIDGGWGAGKTRFCRKLITLFKGKEEYQNHRLIYVDAFEADHADEPLMTLLAAVLEHLPESEQEPLIKKAVPIVRFFGKVALKAASGILLKQNTDDIADGWEKTVEEGSEKAIDHAVESLLKDHVKVKQNLETLRNALAGLAAENPIIIFVDELDRCRPDFAVTMLESIKHVFDISEVKFVLVTNTSQLRAAINHRYGLAVDARRYLDRFLRFSFVLPDKYTARTQRNAHVSWNHFHNLNKNNSILKASGFWNERNLSVLQHLTEYHALSLREVETLTRYLNISLIACDENPFLYGHGFGNGILATFAIFLFCFHPDVCNDIRRGVFDAESLMRVIGRSAIADLNDAHVDYCDFLAALVCLDANVKTDKFEIKGDLARTAWQQKVSNAFDDDYQIGNGKCLEEVRSIHRMLSLGGHR